MSTPAAVPPARSVGGTWSYLRPYKRPIAMGIAMLILTNTLFVGIPVMTGRIVEALRDGQIGLVPGYGAAMMGFAIAVALTRIASRIYIFNAARAAEFDLRGDLFGHLLTLDGGYYRDHSVGDVMSRLTNDVQTVRAMWGAGILQLINTASAFVPVTVMMIWIDPWLTLWAILPYPTIFFVGRLMGRRIFKSSQGVQQELGGLSSRLQEDLGGIQIIKTYGLGDVRRAGFLASSQRLLGQNMALTRVRGQLIPLLNAMSAAGMIIVLWVGGHAVMSGRIDLGELFQFTGYVARLVWPTLALGWMLSLLQRGRASWDRVQTLLQTRPALSDGAGTVTAGASDEGPAALDIRGLTIEIDGRAILTNVELTVPAGSVTAIVGRTGAGKSTLVDAICRLRPVPPGTIFLDGVDVTTQTLREVRAAVGYAPQEAFLFSTTLADNIAMGFGEGRALPRARADELAELGIRPARPGAAPGSDEDLARNPHVIDAVRAAGLARDLGAMPQGLRTVVGERGITLSGGQRQRVALARAIASAPRLLVLDDSLSSVDAETEQQILAALRSVLAGRTAILISHRVAAIRDADQIVVLDQGAIVERGTHQTLLARGGVYADLYRTQWEAARPAGPA